MSDKDLIIEILREVLRTKKEPCENGNPQRGIFIEELKENRCIREETVKYTGAIMANPYDKFIPHEKREYIVDKDLVQKIYGIKFPC